jgi:hypothetical protein
MTSVSQNFQHKTPAYFIKMVPDKSVYCQYFFPSCSPQTFLETLAFQLFLHQKPSIAKAQNTL